MNYYTIPAGRHGAKVGISELLGSFTRETRLDFYVEFDESAIYESIDPANQHDINKLFGFKEGILGSGDSARIGWNYKNGSIWLYPYVHAGGYNWGADSPPPICAINIKERVLCSIIVSTVKYTIKAKNNKAEYIRESTAKIRRLSRPWFGGNETAPHDIKIGVGRVFNMT